MPNSDPRLDQGAPVLLGDVLAFLEETERWGQTIFQAEYADVVGPGGGALQAHLEDVADHLVDS